MQTLAQQKDDGRGKVEVSFGSLSNTAGAMRLPHWAAAFLAFCPAGHQSACLQAVNCATAPIHQG